MKERIKLYSQAIQDLNKVSMEYIQNEARMKIFIETTLILAIAALIFLFLAAPSGL